MKEHYQESLKKSYRMEKYFKRTSLKQFNRHFFLRIYTNVQHSHEKMSLHNHTSKLQ